MEPAAFCIENLREVGGLRLFVGRQDEGSIRVLAIDVETGKGAMGLCPWAFGQNVPPEESQRALGQFHHLVGILATGIFQPGQDFLRGMAPQGIVVFQAIPMGNAPAPATPN